MIEKLKSKGSGRIFGIVGGRNSGKTTLLLQLIKESKNYKATKYCYFYHQEYKDKLKGVTFISKIDDIEKIKNGIIFIDEFSEFFKQNNRHFSEILKQIIGQISHNENILILCGLPRGYNGLISGFIGDNWLLKSLNYKELVGGSGLKEYIQLLSGDFVGGMCLNVPLDKVFFKNNFESVIYDKKMDKKANNINVWEVK